MTIGNPESFAVEFEYYDLNPKMGFARLWINSKQLGVKEDLIYLNGYLISLIDQFLNSEKFHDLESKNEHEKFQILKSKKQKFLIIGSTFIDDFEIYTYKDNSQICLVWKLRNDQKSIFRELENYPTEIQSAIVTEKYLKEIKNKICDEIK